MNETTFIKVYTAKTGYIGINVECITAYRGDLEKIEIWLPNGANITVSYSEDKEGFGSLSHALNRRTVGR